MIVSLDSSANGNLLMFFISGFKFDGHSDPMAIMSSTNTSSVSHSVEANDTESWSDQIRNAMNVNGGDLEHATNADYFLHFLTFGWKVFTLFYYSYCK